MAKLNRKINGNIPAAPDEEKAQEKPTKRGRPLRLTAEDQIVLLRLHEKGRKPSTIARLLSTEDRPISRVTVSRYLRAIEQPTTEVQKALAALRMRAVESWATAMETGEQFGKHTPAKDLLVATGAIRSDQPMDRLIVIVGDGSKPIGELPAIPAEFRLADSSEPAALPAAPIEDSPTSDKP